MSAVKKTPLKSVTKKKGPTLQQIQAEILEMWNASDAGKDVDERRIDELLKMQEAHPDYQAYVECERKHWMESVSEFCQQCLERTRSFIPVNIFETSVEDLTNLGLSYEIAKRIIQKKCLWLVRMSKEEIARMHESDLIGRFNSMQQHLDIIETASVYASLPESFPVDPHGRKAEWRKMIEDNLRQMLLDNDEDKLSDDKIRSPIYNDLQYGPILDMHSVREVRIMKAEDINKTRREIEGITTNEHGTSMFSMSSRPSSLLKTSQQDMYATSSSTMTGVTSDYMIVGQHGMKTKAQYEDEMEDYGTGVIKEPLLELENLVNSDGNEGQEANTTSEDHSAAEEEDDEEIEGEEEGEEEADGEDEQGEGEEEEEEIGNETQEGEEGDRNEANTEDMTSPNGKADDEESNQPATESEPVEQEQTETGEEEDSVSMVVHEIIESVVTTVVGAETHQQDDESIVAPPTNNTVVIEVPPQTIEDTVGTVETSVVLTEMMTIKSEDVEENGNTHIVNEESKHTEQQVGVVEEEKFISLEVISSPNGHSSNELNGKETSLVDAMEAALDLSIDLNAVDDDDDE